MTTQTEAASGTRFDLPDSYAMRTTRPFWWSVRREVWENRSIRIAPLVVAAVALLGFGISTLGLAAARKAALARPIESQRLLIGTPYDVAALVLVVTGLVVAVVYSLDALHGERRDRSLLFWKSLPVSDTTTVLSKAAIPLLIVPTLVFVLTVIVQLLMFAISSVVLLANGMSPASTLVGWRPFEHTLVLAYGLATLALWHAPLYAWFILVSGWARRAVVVWAVVPIIALSALFRGAWGSEDVCALLVYRTFGGVSQALDRSTSPTLYSFAQLTPLKFVTTPGLWIGLALAVVFLAAAVRVRRNTEPI